VFVFLCLANLANSLAETLLPAEKACSMFLGLLLTTLRMSVFVCANCLNTNGIS